MAKRINISIPDNKLHILAAFDKRCKHTGVTRSEMILALIAAEYQEAETDEHCAQEPALPEFLL